MNDEHYRMNALLDHYAPLLTEKQQDICELYYRNDYSLQEIAEEQGISRAAVHDTLKRCRNELEDYEKKLHLLASSEKRFKIYTDIKKIASETVSQLIDECIETEIEGGYDD